MEWAVGGGASCAWPVESKRKTIFAANLHCEFQSEKEVWWWEGVGMGRVESQDRAVHTHFMGGAGYN